MLTLALITGLSCGKASAQQANAVPLLGLAMQSANGDIAGDHLPVAGALRDHGYFTGMVGNLNGRLIPVAESFVTSNVDLAFPPNERLNVVDPYACPNDRIASGSNLHHTFEDYIMDPADDPNFILDDMPFLELDSSFLPWHREYIYR
jgi:arylsulfatase A-like enzyme